MPETDGWQERLMAHMSLHETFEALDDRLLEELENGATSAIIIDRRGMVWFAFCTDPDGEWFLETGDPNERTEETPEGDRNYVPLAPDWIETFGPFVLLSTISTTWLG